MEKINYSDLQFKCGLEIHQQLPDKKLFCNCPCTITDEPAHFTINRKLKALAGETGAIDIAALHEQSKKKSFIYQGYNHLNCLVEIDEEPPHQVNENALHTALLVSKMLHATIVKEIIFMRKTVIDGSNVSGFQRTALIATDGFIETSEGKIGIATVCLEEESAKAVQRTPECDTYNLSRLGIPLIEIATAPDIKTALGAKEAAEKIGMILRSTNQVKRGLGSIRQDVNLSIKGLARVEIKGFQEIRSMPVVIDNEINRQFSLMQKGESLKPEVRKVEPDNTTTFLRPMPGAARMYPETDGEVIHLTEEFIATLKIPELINDKSQRLEQYGISKELAEMLAKKDKVTFFETAIQKFKNLKPAYIAELLIPKLLEIKRKHNINIDTITDDNIEQLLDKLNQNKITKESVEELLVAFAKKEQIDFTKYTTASSDDIEQEIKKIIEENQGLQFGAIMHVVMAKYRGKVDGKLLSELIKKYL